MRTGIIPFKTQTLTNSPLVDSQGLKVETNHAKSQDDRDTSTVLYRAATHKQQLFISKDKNEPIANEYLVKFIQQDNDCPVSSEILDWVQSLWQIPNWRPKNQVNYQAYCKVLTYLIIHGNTHQQEIAKAQQLKFIPECHATQEQLAQYVENFDTDPPDNIINWGQTLRNIPDWLPTSIVEIKVFNEIFDLINSEEDNNSSSESDEDDKDWCAFFFKNNSYGNEANWKKEDQIFGQLFYDWLTPKRKKFKKMSAENFINFSNALKNDARVRFLLFGNYNINTSELNLQVCHQIHQRIINSYSLIFTEWAIKKIFKILPNNVLTPIHMT